MTPPLDHPMRDLIDAELHSRPPLDVRIPALVFHWANMCDQKPSLHGLIAPICDALEVVPPQNHERHIIRKTLAGALKWERHGEFETLTFVENNASRSEGSSFWLDNIAPIIAKNTNGTRISASCMQIQPLSDGDASSETLRSAPGTAVGVRLSGGDAFLWTDYKIADDGYIHMQLDAVTMSPRRAGRIVQRLLEIETYRFTALLGFPVARRAQASVGEKNQHLDAIINDMDPDMTLEACQALLERIQRLSHETNVLFGETAFRFAATKAYNAIVERRLVEIREERISGFSRPSTFLKRRMTPAIDHCASIERQRDTLERRLSETSQMLRTKVETGHAEHNKQLLEQIKASTQSQVKLQHAVEGFSVVAISYYLVSIMAVFLKGGEKAGLLEGWELYEAALAPVAILAVILLVRRAASKK